jgi:hypothetical protein
MIAQVLSYIVQEWGVDEHCEQLQGYRVSVRHRGGWRTAKGDIRLNNIHHVTVLLKRVTYKARSPYVHRQTDGKHNSWYRDRLRDTHISIHIGSCVGFCWVSRTDGMESGFFQGQTNFFNNWNICILFTISRLLYNEPTDRKKRQREREHRQYRLIQKEIDIKGRQTYRLTRIWTD